MKHEGLTYRAAMSGACLSAWSLDVNPLEGAPNAHAGVEVAWVDHGRAVYRAFFRTTY